MRSIDQASRWRRGVHASAGILVPLLVLAACSPASTATSSLAAVSTPRPTRSPTPTPARASSPDATAPAVLPNFPVMPGSAAVAPQPGDPSPVASWTSTADGARVYDFFVEALPAAGFHIERLAPGGEAAIIRFRSPGTPQFELSLSSEGDQTRIDLRLVDTAD
jgi:hypothetical protein